MFNIQYCLIFVCVQTCDFFLLPARTSPPKLLKYNGDIPASNAYYTSTNVSPSASLIDFLRTVYEEEKNNGKQVDYNLIRALAPRVGKADTFSFFFHELNVCVR